jgi:hypothetical protein
MKLNESSRRGGPLGVFARLQKRTGEWEKLIFALAPTVPAAKSSARGPEYKSPAPLPAQGHFYYNFFKHILLV